jgi:amino acid transporter
MIALALAAPLWIVLLPVMEYRYEDDERASIYNTVVAYVAIFIAYCTFNVGYDVYLDPVTWKMPTPNITNLVQVFGVLSWIVIMAGLLTVISYGFSRIILYTKEYWSKNERKMLVKVKGEKTVNIFTLIREYIKAKYKNYCPQINWE